MPRQSTVIFWFLVVATLSADAMAAYTVTSDGKRLGLIYTLNVWSALVLAQVSVAAIWVVFRTQSGLWSWLLPPAILVAASVLRAKVGLFGSWSTLDYGCRTALQMLLTMVVIWPLVRTPLWRRWAPDVCGLKWEFSLRQMLGWTTVVALLSAIVARATWTDRQPLSMSLTAGIFAPTAVSLGVVLLATSPLPWIARIIGYMLVGAAVATVLNALLDWRITDRLLVEFIAEALLIAAWVEWGGVIPRTLPTFEDQPVGAPS
ncbi:MAG: hypothetical protein IT427_16620 [Pirellulales bacterium]|nr:hypothetical protein [Pirellulales bacterium]